MSSSTFLTVHLEPWLAIFVSVESSRMIVSMDLNQDLKVIGGKIKITLKNNKNFDVFC